MSTWSERLAAVHAALFGRQEVERIPEFFAPDYLAHVGGDRAVRGTDAVRQFVQNLHRAFPSLEVRVEVLLEEGERLAWRRMFRGVQAGAYQGFPASGKSILWCDMVVSRVENDRIVEEWMVSDLAEQLLRGRKGSYE